MIDDDRSPDGAGEGDLPVDTLTEPHEPVVRTASTAMMWVYLLAGPVLAMTHFWLVYLAAEASCLADDSDGMRFLSVDSFVVTVLVVTAVGCALALAAAWLARRADGPLQQLAGVGLSIGGAVVIAAVGLPILVVGPC